MIDPRRDVSAFQSGVALALDHSGAYRVRCSIKGCAPFSQTSLIACPFNCITRQQRMLVLRRIAPT